jgi:hypothetical protein
MPRGCPLFGGRTRVGDATVFKPKKAGHGTEVEMEAIIGTWYDTKRVSDEMDEFGKACAQSRFINALSIFLRLGLFLLLDQVKARSISGRSIRERWFIASLKISASCCL